MYSHNIEEMTKAIAKKLGYKGNVDKIKEIKEVIEKYWSDKIAIVWTVSDVQDYAKSNGIKISKAKAYEILSTIHHNHDAEFGVTWSVIREYLG